jgi:ligand-binding sensor domain-containing protein/DNA-binding CsgD family transcriptional regulator
MKQFHRVILVSIYLSTIVLLSADAQNRFFGVPAIEYFDAEDYQGHISNLYITQDHRGIMYMANEHGLLEYDGSRWKQYYVFNGERGVTAVYTDPSGTLYVGRGEIGYYSPRPNGQYAYHSLHHLLPDDYRVRGIGKILPYKKGYVFVGVKNFYFYDLDSIRLVQAEFPNSFHTYLCRGELYTNINGKGISVFTGQDWNIIPGGELLANMSISGLISHTNGAMLAFTERSGVFLIGDGRITPFAHELWSHFSNEVIQSATKLSDGFIAIGTRNNGLYILDQRGKLAYHLNHDKGLSTSNIRDVFQDSYGNIWLARENGLVKIDWNSSFSYIRDDMNLDGVGYCALTYNDFIYFGTSTGLFRAEKKWPLDSIIQIDNIRSPVYNIQNINGDLLVSGQYNSYQLIGDTFEPISPGVGWMHYAFKETRDPNILIRGNLSGIFRLEKTNGRWAVTKKYENFEEWTKFLEFDKEDRLWTTSSIKGIFSFTFSEDYQEVSSMKSYGPSKGLPSNDANKVFKIGDELIFSTSNGIFEYIQSNDEFQASIQWNERFASKAHVFEISRDGFGNIYYCDMKQPGRLERNIQNQYTNESYIFDGLKSQIGGRLAILDNDNILFSNPKGFIHYNRKTTQNKSTNAKILIRYVKLSRSDSVLFGGNFLSEGNVVDHQPVDNIPKLSSDNNSIIIGYSAIQYNHDNTLYRFQLEGFDDGWSQWTTKTEKEYTNLDKGDYTFMVQTKSANEQLSVVETYKFEIIPPWYRTSLFYSLLVISSLGFTSLIVLKTRKKEIGKLRKENLQTEITHKKKQLATTTMHLVEKTEFVNSVKSELVQVLESKSADENERLIKRVIRQIDKNIADDDNWEDFEHHFDEVHHGFLKRMRKNYPTITPQEIRLSAYLRMNMTTKEIANLLKVSVRAVEMARFRLRRRLDLGKEENLVTFMMNS